ncbi:MAG: hypothetical protein ACYC5A_11140 [Thermoleophilia bacterium]
MKSIYWGLDVGQIIFAAIMIMILIGFATWGYRTRERIRELEEIVLKRDFRELEAEGFEEETNVDAFSEGARLEAEEQMAREQDIRGESS